MLQQLRFLAGQCYENYSQARNVTCNSYPGRKLKERSDKLRLSQVSLPEWDITLVPLHEQLVGEAGDKVTIHQLLNHTAGMANIDRNLTNAASAIKNGIPHYQMPLTTDELVAKYCSERLVNEPGKVFDYNNADYIILGKIIEQIHDKTYEQVLQETILRPLKMEHSGMLYQHNILDNLADTYFFRDDLKTLVNDLPVYIENWYAAGAMYSTANDVLKFSNALFGAKLLKQETLALMLKSGLDNYGYGVWRYESKFNNKTQTVVKRPGRIMGAQSMLFHVLDEDVTIIILSNTDATSLDEFVAEIGKQVRLCCKN